MTNEDYEECEECGIIDEAVKYHEEIDDLGRYLCDACYYNAKAEIEVDES